MKIIHCADIHLDSPMESKLTKEKSKKRKIELIENFKEMVEYAKKENVKIIIIAGDLFDDTKKTMLKTTKKYIINIIKENSEIDFIYLRGNHDINNFLEGEEKPQNIKTFEEEWKQYRYEDIVISGAELNKNAENIYDKLILKYEDYNIVTLHGQIDKSANPRDKAETIYLSKLRNRNIDYLALGHIHKREEGKLDNRGEYSYSGCLEGRSFDECGEKGFIVLEIEKNKLIKKEFIKHSKRTIYNIEIDITQIETQNQFEEEILKKICNIEQKDLVRVTLTGTYEVKKIGEEVEDYLDIEKIENKYNDEYFYFEVKNNVKIIINYKEFKNDISLKGEFIRTVEQEELSEDEKSEICLTGIRAILGGEI